MEYAYIMLDSLRNCHYNGVSLREMTIYCVILQGIGIIWVFPKGCHYSG